ncbi:MAG: hypothetical protein AB1571_04315 [Nanoarchaeota archaeon]
MTKKFNFYIGTSASSLLLAILVVIAELSEFFKGALNYLFIHHWIGKAVLMALALFIFGFAFRRDIERDIDLKIAWRSILASLIIIVLFNIINFLPRLK